MWFADVALPVPPPQQIEFGRILIPSLWLAGGLLLAAVIIMIVRNWRQRSEQISIDPVHDQLAHFRALYDKGQMSKEEYKRVHDLLAGLIRQQAQLAPPVPVASPEQPKASQNGEPKREDAAGNDGAAGPPTNAP